MTAVAKVAHRFCVSNDMCFACIDQLIDSRASAGLTMTQPKPGRRHANLSCSGC